MGIVFGRTGVSEPSYSMVLSRSGASTLPYELRRYGHRFAVETDYGGEPETRSSFMRLAGYIGVGGPPENHGGRKIAMTAPVVTSGADGGQAVAMTAPENDGGRKIAMTAPVVTSGTDGGQAVAMTAPENDGGRKIAKTAPVVTSGTDGGQAVATDGGQAVAMTATVVTDPNEKVMQFILPEEFDELEKIPRPTSELVRVKEVKEAVGAVHRFSGWVKADVAGEKTKALIEQLKEDGCEMEEEEGLKKSLVWQFHPPFTIPFLRRNEVWVELTEEQVESLKKAAENLGK